MRALHFRIKIFKNLQMLYIQVQIQPVLPMSNEKNVL